MGDWIGPDGLDTSRPDDGSNRAQLLPFHTAIGKERNDTRNARRGGAAVVVVSRNTGGLREW